MKLCIFLALCVISLNVFAKDKSQYTPEQLFVIGTELFKKEENEFNPKLGLEFMLESAKFKYEHAPFGLCVSLSTTKEILDLKEAYSWCYVAEKIGNEFSKIAEDRSKEILGKILLDDGIEAVSEAKELGILKYSQ
ncbi:hypothetical protein A9267_21190 [Shewanella sp. UCD-FRSSP16_17]|uniref:hypothetical protein n=1 Tax=Shewanella sp. UCD-FRSSP16_17 TaxID=1853256 RepID=UPI0007EEF1FE|nr:hypothetical protein [Shewanella sp. UCD-FRSSP16_17]OBT08643.1 hypothetical protein A9267_21190 [Shewanella sp. UCD-FRSSP16_17]